MDEKGHTIYRQESLLIGEKGERAVNESPGFEEDKDELSPEEA